MCFGFTDTEYEAVPPPRRVRTVKVKAGKKFRSGGLVYQYIWNGRAWALHQIVSMALAVLILLSHLKALVVMVLVNLLFLSAMASMSPSAPSFRKTPLLATRLAIHLTWTGLHSPCVMLRKDKNLPASRASNNKQLFPVLDHTTPLPLSTNKLVRLSHGFFSTQPSRADRSCLHPPKSIDKSLAKTSLLLLQHRVPSLRHPSKRRLT